MADFTDRVKLVFDAVTGDATRDVGKLKGATDEAQTGWGKLKSTAGDAVKSIASSPIAIAGAGVAIGKIAFDLASGFQDAALSANDFAQATGLSVDAASRWQEVAGDVGVSTETLEGAVNKLNLAAGKGALRDLGIGGADTNDQLLNALQHIQGIPDASERATQGVKIFGKSWTSLAPLVEEAGDLKQALADVSSGQAISEEEVEKAKRMRDAIDSLTDRFDALKTQVGGELATLIGDVATAIGNVADQADSLTEKIPGMGSAWETLTSPLRNVGDGYATLTDGSKSLIDRARGLGQAITGSIPGPLGSWAAGMFDVEDAQDDAAEATDRANAAAKRQAAAAKEAEDAMRALTDATLASFNSQLGLADAADRTDEAIGKYTAASDLATASNWGNADANKAARQAMNDAEQAALGQAAAADKAAGDMAKHTGANYDAADSARVQADALRTVAGTLAPDSPLRANLLAYAGELDKIPPTAHTTVTADTTDAERDIKGLMGIIQSIVFKPFTVKVNANTSAVGSSAVTGPATSGTGVGLRAVGAPQTALASPVAGAGGAAPSAGVIVYNNVSVTVPVGTPTAEVGRYVADALDAHERRSGSRRRVA